MTKKDLFDKITAGTATEADVQTYTDALTSELYGKLDGALQAAGVPKPTGAKTIDFVVSLTTELKTAKQQAQSAAEALKGAPDVAKLQAAHETALGKVRDEYEGKLKLQQRDVVASAFDAALASVKLRDELKDAAKEVLSVKTQQALEQYDWKKHEGKFVAYQNNEPVIKDGGLLTHDVLASSFAAPFAAQAQQQNTQNPPPGGTPPASKITIDQAEAFAKQNGIDLTTLAGLQQLAKSV